MANKIRVAITGAAGLVGSRIADLLTTSFDIIPLTHDDIDITDKKNVEAVASSLSFDYLIHCAAYTNVDGAEQNEKQAYVINVDGLKNIFAICKQKSAKLILISTDFVFDGTNPPYFENSTPNPLSVYAKSKFEGEQIIKDNAMTIRISYPYRSTYKKSDFARTIKRLLQEGKAIHAITDSLFTPTHIDDVAQALKHLIPSYSHDIFHIVGDGALSPFDAAHIIAAQFDFDTSLIKPVSFEDFFKSRAKRPQYSDIRSKKNDFAPMRSFEKGVLSIES